MDDEAMRAVGFEAGELAYKAHAAFTLSELRDSLICTYNEPKFLTFDIMWDQAAPLARLLVGVSLFKPIYLKDGPGCINAPEYYLEGWIVQSGFHPGSDGLVRVRCYLQTDGNGELESDGCYLQRIPAESNPVAPITRAPGPE